MPVQVGVVVGRGADSVLVCRPVAVVVGAIADLTLVAGETLAHAVVEESPRPLVVKGGRIVARNGALTLPGINMP